MWQTDFLGYHFAQTITLGAAAVLWQMLFLGYALAQKMNLGCAPTADMLLCLPACLPRCRTRLRPDFHLRLIPGCQILPG